MILLTCIKVKGCPHQAAFFYALWPSFALKLLEVKGNRQSTRDLSLH
jgi:hypothetical protein